MGVPKEKGECNTLLLFIERVTTLGTTTERSDTPPILMVVLCVTGLHLRGGIDHREVTHQTDMTRIGKWNSTPRT